MSSFDQNRFGDFLSNWKALRALDSKGKESKETIRTAAWVWVIRILLVAMIFASPWQNGLIAWKWQAYLVLAAIPIGLLAPLVAWLRRGPTLRLQVPGVTLLLLAMALYASFQALPLFSMKAGFVPGSVRIQQWFLGESVEPPRGMFSEAMHQSVDRSKELREGMDAGSAKTEETLHQNARLAISVCPGNTKAAIGSLMICAALIWMSSLVFTDRNGHSFLLHAVAALGLVMAVLLFAETVAWETPPWAMNRTQKLVGTFVNKNAAGAFLSVCLSCSVGLAASSLRKLHSAKRKRDRRYEISTVGPFARYTKSIFDFLSGFETVHVAYLLITVFLFASVIATMSRGAGLSCAAASILVAMLYASRKSNHIAIWMAGGLILAMASALIVFLDIETEAASRYDSLLDGETLGDRGRLYIYWVTLRAAAYYWLTGCGFANYGFATLPFFEESGSSWHYYSESIWGHVLVELGILGLLLLVLLAIELRGLIRSSLRVAKLSSNYLVLFGVVFGLSYTLIHSIVDFRLVVPAIYIPSSILLGALYGFVFASPNTFTLEKVLPRGEQGKEEPDSGSEDLLLAMSKVKQKREKKKKPKENRVKPIRPVSALTQFDSRNWKGWLTAALLTLFLWQSWQPIQRGAFARELEIWTTDHLANDKEFNLEELNQKIKLVKEQPSDSLSHDSFRFLANMELRVWEEEYKSKVEEVDGIRIKKTEATPFLIRMILTQSNAEVEKLIQRYGGNSLFDRWKVATTSFRSGAAKSPLDWRLQLGASMWDLESSTPQTLIRLNRWVPLGQHRPNDLYECGVLAELLGARRLASDSLADGIQIQNGLALNASKLLFPRLQEDRINPELFPTDYEVLRGIVISPEFQALRKENQLSLWSHIERELEKPSGKQAAKYFLQYAIETHKGSNEKAEMVLERWKAEFPGDQNSMVNIGTRP